MATSPWFWPLWWRVLILLNVSFYNFLGNASAAGAPPLFSLIIDEFHISQQDASQLSTYMLLALGISNILALPFISLFGKRYSILLSQIVFLAANIWSGEAATYQALKGSRILGGLAAGLIEAIGPRIVIETFPEHQLASAMVVYVGFLAAGSAVGPIVAGAIAHGLHSWRWYMRILSIAIFCNTACSILMLPETNHVGHDEHRPSDADDDAFERQLEEKAEAVCREDQQIEAGNVVTLRDEYWQRSFTTRFAKLAWKTALINLIRPFELIIAPQVLIVTLVFGVTIGWSVMVSILNASVYAQPPLLWNSLSIGALTTSSLIGLLIGLPIGGPFADYLSRRATRRMDGRHQQGSRLPAVLFGALVSPAGCLVYGYGFREPGQHWLQACVGWAMLSVGLTSSANILLTYAVDCMPRRADHIGALVNLTKNCIAFGVSYASITWMEEMGPVKQFAITAAILWALYLCVIPMGFLSKTIIKKTAWLAE
ncbi:hypothetical protein SEUCBS139899_008151 [Sporothrix eucalyptigena]|uniref:Major facilitator superfamily (MFS) profile domain-containing protein n=1 Tax=Sporothrix eucalyptigena TaxID=1812306 RepID=A0ABP0C7N6_9PEZI